MISTVLSRYFRPMPLLSGILAAYFFFGLFHIGQFITADEHYWIYERIPAYFDAIDDGKWKKTLISDKPGVTLALVSGPALLFFDDPESHCTEGQDKIIRCDITRSESLLFAFRFPLLLANIFLLLVSFFLLRAAFRNEWIALLTMLFTATAPILVGISQISNPDALLWSLGFAAIASYLAWLRTNRFRFFLSTALFFGFALLAKYAVLVLLPFFLLFSLVFFLFEKNGDASFQPTFRKHLLFLLALPVIACALFALFLPAVIVNPDGFLKTLSENFPKFNPKTLGIGLSFFALPFLDAFLFRSRIFLSIKRLWTKKPYAGIRPFPLVFLFTALVSARYAFPQWDIFSAIPFDMKDLSNARYYTESPLNIWEKIFLETNPFLFSLAPLPLFGMLAAWILATFRNDFRFLFETTVLSLSLFYFLLVLIVGNTLGTPRYLVLLFPLASLIAAIGYLNLFHILKERFFSFRFARELTFLLFFIGSLVPLFFAAPFFLNYSNFLLPKHALISDAWGSGGYEAAQYLNALPNAERLTVWSDYYGVCEFFVGRCLTAYTFDREIVKPDYYILTRRGEMRYMSRFERWERLSGLQAHLFYDRTDPDWSFPLHGNPNNSIRIFKLR